MRLSRPVVWSARVVVPIARAIRRELALFLSLGVAAGAIWIFAEIADDVIERETRSFDEAILLMMRNPADHTDPLGPGWVEELGRDFTALGGVGVLTFLTLAVAVFLLLERKGRAALFVLAAVGSGLLLSQLLKMGFDRPRPDLVPHEALVYTASFPSGHSTLAAVTYLTLGALLARVHQSLIIKIYLISLATLLTVVVGISRVYLGVHWPTDVLAGWTIGAAWASLWWALALWMQRRGRVESGLEGASAQQPDNAAAGLPTAGR